MDRIRYVWGKRKGPKAREVYAKDGVVEYARYTAYFGPPESHTVTLYPDRLFIRGTIKNFTKKVVALRDIYDK